MGLQTDRLAVDGDGPVQVSPLAQAPGKVVVGRDVVRVGANNLAEFGVGLVPATHAK